MSLKGRTQKRLMCFLPAPEPATGASTPSAETTYEIYDERLLGHPREDWPSLHQRSHCHREQRCRDGSRSSLSGAYPQA